MSDVDDYDFDLDSLVVEAEGSKPFVFRWREQSWEMPLMDALDLSDQLALENATVEESLRIIMGGEQWDRFIAEPISTGRTRALIKQWRKWQGLNEGESRASSRSSVSTARRSRRTSRSGR